MKSSKVLKILQITRPTLTKYVKEGKIRVETMPNGFYSYNDEDVYAIAGYTEKRISVAYSRVSTLKQKNDLDNQERTIIAYCNSKGIGLSESYKDIASGMDFNRTSFLEMFKKVMDREIGTIYITYKDRFSRIAFDLFKNIFKKFDCDIVVINDIEDNKTNETEIFEEIISMLHCFAMKMYSKRRKTKLKPISKDLENEISI